MTRERELRKRNERKNRDAFKVFSSFLDFFFFKKKVNIQN